MADLPLTRELIDALGRRCVGDLLLFVQARAALDLADEVKRLRAKVEVVAPRSPTVARDAREGDGVLIVTVELWPFGSEQRKRTLGVLRIANDGTGTSAIGNYSVTVFAPPSDEGTAAVRASGRIEGFTRRLGFWALINHALTNLRSQIKP